MTFAARGTLLTTASVVQTIGNRPSKSPFFVFPHKRYKDCFVSNIKMKKNIFNSGILRANFLTFLLSFHSEKIGKGEGKVSKNIREGFSLPTCSPTFCGPVTLECLICSALLLQIREKSSFDLCICRGKICACACRRDLLGLVQR